MRSPTSKSQDQSSQQPQVKQDEERSALNINDTMPIDRSYSINKTRAVVSNPPPLRVHKSFMHWKLCGLHLFPIGSVTFPLHSLIFCCCHPSKMPGLTISPPQTLLLVKVPPAVHLNLSSSLSLRFPPLIVLCRPRTPALTSCSAFSLTIFSFLFYGTYSCAMMSMSKRTSVLRMEIAQAWRRLLKLLCRILSSHMLQRSDQVASRSNWVVS